VAQPYLPRTSLTISLNGAEELWYKVEPRDRGRSFADGVAANNQM
jgi:hypothetical protein